MSVGVDDQNNPAQQQREMELWLYDIESSFQVLDQDHDGYLTINEFLALYWGLGFEEPRQMAREQLENEVRHAASIRQQSQIHGSHHITGGQLESFNPSSNSRCGNPDREQVDTNRISLETVLLVLAKASENGEDRYHLSGMRGFPVLPSHIVCLVSLVLCLHCSTPVIATRIYKIHLMISRAHLPFQRSGEIVIGRVR
jgi:hypothetical protein